MENISAAVRSPMRHALGLDHALLDEYTGDTDGLFDMIDRHATQLQMIDDAAFGAERKARAVANEGARKLDVIADLSHDPVEGQALPEVNETERVLLHLIANAPQRTAMKQAGEGDW
jgi:hypothetical protein